MRELTLVRHAAAKFTLRALTFQPLNPRGCGGLVEKTETYVESRDRASEK